MPKKTLPLVVAIATICTASLGCGLMGSQEVAEPVGPPTWEYKVVAVYSEGNDRIDDEALAFGSVSPSESEMNTLGLQGWELATSYLEMETAYPNFGNQGYVTGIQPNVRPQRVVFIFKRPLPVLNPGIR